MLGGGGGRWTQERGKLGPCSRQLSERRLFALGLAKLPGVFMAVGPRPRGTDLLFLGEPHSWPSIHATARAAWGAGRGPRGGSAKDPRGHTGWGSASPAGSQEMEHEVEP